MTLSVGYKESDVGPIPIDWDIKPLGSVLREGRLGGNYPNQDMEAELPLMKMGNIARGSFDLSKVEYIKPGTPPDDQHRLAYGDVLFNTRNTLELVGKVAIWREELPLAYYNSNLMRLEFDRDFIFSNEFANYALNSKGSIARLRGLATGTTSVAAIYTRDLKKFQVTIPPASEQIAIAQALGDIDDLITSLDAVIAKKRDIKEGAMQTMLGGLNAGNELEGSIGADCYLHARIGWQGLTVEEYKKSGECILVTGTDFEGGRINFSSCAYVDNWRFKQDRKIQINKNDVLVTKDGTIGKSAFVCGTPLPATLNSGIFVDCR